MKKEADVLRFPFYEDQSGYIVKKKREKERELKGTKTK